jgi:dTDP-4-amino-4,6-dideoxygalactose transaminase
MLSSFPIPLANAQNFPKPEILATADCLISSILKNKKKNDSQFFSNSFFTKNGRSALARVVKALKLTQGDIILLPEYFCPAMVEPLLWYGLIVKFYRLNENLTVDQSSFESLIDDNVKACLFVRYFGLSCNIENSLLLAKKHNLLVIEDCAHSFFTPLSNINGVSFDASICSLNKFFPCTDGGMFHLEDKFFDIKGAYERDIKEEVKSIISFFKLDGYLSWLKSLIIKPNNIEKSVSSAGNTEYRYFNPQDKHLKCFKISEFVITFSDHKKIVSNRKVNFDLLYDKLQNSPTGRVLINRKANETPYVLPFLLNDKNDFTYIRQQGVQILRWEEFYYTENSIIENYRENLIQIPCHQNLSLAQIEKLVSVINKENT